MSSKAEQRKALERLKAARRGGVSRLTQYQASEEEALYEEVDEQEYRAMVDERRRNTFVVGDDDLGYVDDGEEYISSAPRRRGHARAAGQGKGGRGGALNSASLGTARRLNLGAGAQSTRVDRLMAKGRARAGVRPGTGKSVLTRKKMAAKQKADEDFLAAELAALDDAADEAADEDASHVAQMERQRVRKRQRRSAPAHRAAAAATAATTAATATDDTAMGGADDDDGDAAAAAADVDVDMADEETATDAAAAPKRLSRKEAKARLFAKAKRARAQAPSKARAEAMAAAKRRAAEVAAKIATSNEEAPLVQESEGDWTSVQASDTAAAAAEAPLPKDLKVEDGALQMFWLDAYEHKSKPGTVYLFGKVIVSRSPLRFASCCVVVQGVERVVYLLRRDGCSNKDVYDELNKDIMPRLLKRSDRVWRVKGDVSKRYCFEEPGVPEEADYMELRYPASASPMDRNASGRTFSRVFASHQTALERFLLSRDLMGPCWLTINNVRPNAVNTSWCKYEVSVARPTHVTRRSQDAPTLPTPSLNVMSLSVKTIVNPKNHRHEVVALSMLVHHGFNIDGPTPPAPGQISHFSIVRAPGHGVGMPRDLPSVLKDRASKSRGRVNIAVCPNERALLSLFLAKLGQFDPDVLAGHNISGFTLDVLLHRMAQTRVNLWSRIGRLRRDKMPNSSAKSGGAGTTFFGVVAAGRLVCDTLLSARELIRETSYSLTNLAARQLKTRRADVEPMDVPRYYSTGESTVALVKHTENDAYLVLQLMKKLVVLPLTKQLTNLSGNLWARSLLGARAERIEYLLLHEFHRRGYILPDKQPPKKKDGPTSRSKRRKAAYAGGLVLEPRKGLYDKYVLLLDFNSLYPSIIQEYNICFTTVEREAYKRQQAAQRAAANRSSGGGAGGGAGAGAGAADDGEDDDDDEAGNAIPPVPDQSKFKDLAVLPTVIRTLVQRRRQVKNMIKTEKDAVKSKQLDIRQKALKILANSMYGCLGFSNSRFYARPIAALVTSKGREILQNTVTLAESTLNLDVIYGDTDSIMINTRSTDIAKVRTLGNQVKREVNKLYKMLEIEIDGIFKMMLLLKKKKYAALTVVQDAKGKVIGTEKETKGLDLVRRDWCVMSKEVGNKVLDIILSGEPCETVVDSIHSLMRELADNVRNDKMALRSYVITKGISKAPHEYADAKGLPHLQVALRLMKMGKPVNVGDHIPYIICKPEAEPAVSPPASSPSRAPGAAAAASGAAATTATGLAAASSAQLASPAPSTAATTATPGSAASAATSSTTAASPSTPTVSATAAPTQQQQQKKKKKSKSGNANSVAFRARHPTEVAKSKTLKVDFEWYLSNQILPPIVRLCEPIEGTSAAQLAECLGLDAAKYHRTFARGDDDDDDFALKSLLSQADRFKDAEPLSISCDKCGKQNAFPGVFGTTPAGAGPVPKDRLDGLHCVQCGGFWKDAPLGNNDLEMGELDAVNTELQNALTLAMRKHVLEHMNGWTVCDDHLCGKRSRDLTTHRLGEGCTAKGCRGRVKLESTFEKLHTQLDYFDAVFSVDAAQEKAEEEKTKPLALSQDVEDVFRELQSAAQRFKDCSAFEYVNMAAVTSYAATASPPR